MAAQWRGQRANREAEQVCEACHIGGSAGPPGSPGNLDLRRSWDETEQLASQTEHTGIIGPAAAAPTPTALDHLADNFGNITTTAFEGIIHALDGSR